MPRAQKKPQIIDFIVYDGKNEEEIKEFAKGFVVTGPAIDTPSGAVNIVAGDHIIRGSEKDYYPCKPDRFAELYDILPD